MLSKQSYQVLKSYQMQLFCAYLLQCALVFVAFYEHILEVKNALNASAILLTPVTDPFSLNMVSGITA